MVVCITILEYIFHKLCDPFPIPSPFLFQKRGRHIYCKTLDGDINNRRLLDGDDVHTFGKDAKGEESLRTCDMEKGSKKRRHKKW